MDPSGSQSSSQSSSSSSTPPDPPTGPGGSQTSDSTTTTPTSTSGSTTSSPSSTTTSPSSGSTSPSTTQSSGGSTSNGGGSSSTPTTSSTVSTSKTTLSNGSVSSVIQTIFVTTNGNGGQVTLTTFLPATSQPNTNSGGGTQDHTAAIVGASVGGGIAVALGVLLWFIMARHRRAKRHRAFEQDIFNPDHTTRGPDFDLGAGAIPVPYSYEPDEMRQADPSGIIPGQHPAGPGLQHPGYYAPEHEGAGLAGAGAGAAALAGAAAFNHPSDGTTSSGMGRSTSMSSRNSSGTPLMAVGAGRAPSVGTTTAYNPAAASGRSAKEREAFARTRVRDSMPLSPTAHSLPMSPTSHGSTPSLGSTYASHPAMLQPGHGHNRGFIVANSDEPNGLPNPYGSESPSRAMSPSSMDGTDAYSNNRMSYPSVMVHQDGGRVPQHEPNEAREIPPTYDSIPREEIQRYSSTSPTPSGRAHTPGAP